MKETTKTRVIKEGIHFFAEWFDVTTQEWVRSANTYHSDRDAIFEAQRHHVRANETIIVWESEKHMNTNETPTPDLRSEAAKEHADKQRNARLKQIESQAKVIK